MFLIPMAGLSSRFYDAGYSLPKFMLEARGETLFYHSLSSFYNYFITDLFVFIIRGGLETREFINHQVIKLGIKSYIIVCLDNTTQGQAETVYLGLKRLSSVMCDERLTIFNIDTMRPKFIYPKLINNCDAYLEVFKGHGKNWSYVRIDDDVDCSVVETAEKEVISDLCSTGLYHFSRLDIFNKAYEDYYIKSDTHIKHTKEHYVAPIYNSILNDYDIRYYKIDPKDVIFFGIPSEYEKFKTL
ncbi:capsular biosynthesis protein [Photorhabdus laumondii]